MIQFRSETVDRILLKTIVQSERPVLSKSYVEPTATDPNPPAKSDELAGGAAVEFLYLHLHYYSYHSIEFYLAEK